MTLGSLLSPCGRGAWPPPPRGPDPARSFWKLRRRLGLACEERLDAKRCAAITPQLTVCVKARATHLPPGHFLVSKAAYAGECARGRPVPILPVEVPDRRRKGDGPRRPRPLLVVQERLPGREARGRTPSRRRLRAPPWTFLASLPRHRRWGRRRVACGWRSASRVVTRSGSTLVCPHRRRAPRGAWRRTTCFGMAELTGDAPLAPVSLSAQVTKPVSRPEAALRRSRPRFRQQRGPGCFAPSPPPPPPPRGRGGRRPARRKSGTRRSPSRAERTAPARSGTTRSTSPSANRNPHPRRRRRRCPSPHDPRRPRRCPSPRDLPLPPLRRAPANPEAPAGRMLSSALTGLLGAALVIAVVIASARSDAAAGWLGLAPSAEVVATRVVSGLYDTAGGKPVFYVRRPGGKPRREGPRPRPGHRRVGRRRRSRRAKAETIAGAEPTPEDVWSRPLRRRRRAAGRATSRSPRPTASCSPAAACPSSPSSPIRPPICAITVSRSAWRRSRRGGRPPPSAARRTSEGRRRAGADARLAARRANCGRARRPRCSRTWRRTRR